MAIDIERLLPSHTVEVIRAAGLHKVAGVMTGVGEMTLPRAAGVIAAKAYERRKTAQMIATGIVSLATVEKQAVSPETAAQLRSAIVPAAKGG